YYSLEEIEAEQERAVVRKLKELMELRNNHPAFNLEGDIKIQCEGSKMKITRSYNNDQITLVADLMNYEFEIQ
ncbi:MAG: sucrose phosphorylase, partial [Clostridium sp.]